MTAWVWLPWVRFRRASEELRRDRQDLDAARARSRALCRQEAEAGERSQQVLLRVTDAVQEEQRVIRENHLAEHVRRALGQREGPA